jgi:hypothetical protein
MKRTIFWNVMPYHLVEVHFSGYFFDSLFNPEDGDRMFLWSISELLPYCLVLLSENTFITIILLHAVFSLLHRRPPGNPTEHVRSFDMKEKIKRRRQFEDFVNSKEAEVEHLKRQVSAGRMHMFKLENILDEEVTKLHSFFEGEKKYQAELQAHFHHLTKQVQ